MGKLYTLLDEPTRVKIITGPFANDAVARERVHFIRQAGYKDAFVKKINTNLLHEVTDFELGAFSTISKLNAAVEAILEENPPQNYEVISAKKSTRN